MSYNGFRDYYICKNNKKLAVNRTIKRKSKTDYVSEKTVYTCEDCSNCEYKSKCIKGHNCKTPLEERTKNIETLKLLNMLRRENLERIVSEENHSFREVFVGKTDKNINPKTIWMIIHKRWNIENSCFYQLKSYCNMEH
ncbi:hypothetical protein BS101_04070 [Clostridium kluyveri]|uniref:Uncharacterized protein n=2 Tax=Clostridium kluyveri TaxID=1534 RepID=A0A1L5F4R8_CLOKL|nr:hypothetical protein BS101_04070 [Clostridium kluyveri]